MSKIDLYNIDNVIDDDDKVIGTDFSGSVTKNYEMLAIKSYVGSTSVVTKKVRLTSTQLLSLNGGGSIELIEAPGQNKVISIISIAGFLDFNTTVFNFNNNVLFRFGNNTQSTLFTTTINSSEDLYFSLDNQGGGSSSILLPNTKLTLFADSGITATTGDSTLTISIVYRIIDFS